MRPYLFQTGLLVVLASFWLCTGTLAQQDRSDYVSDASYTIGSYRPGATDHSAAETAAAANRFLKSLDDKQRRRVQHALDSDARLQWTNLPARPDAAGVPLGELNEVQVQAFCDLMRALFSEQGYNKMRDIMLADDQLLQGGRPRPGFGTETYAVVLFGEPAANAPWAFQLNGHHIGVNVALDGSEMTLSPSHIGTQPETFRLGERRIRPLSGEVDDAFELAGSLTDEQFKKALVQPRRGGIVTGPGNDKVIPQPKGVSCSEFNDQQKQKLVALISNWVANLPPEQAHKRLKAVEGEIDEMHFAWFGPRKPGSDMSYRIQGPSLIVEYACQDLGGVPTNHLHTNYRNPTNEYGKQLDD